MLTLLHTDPIFLLDTSPIIHRLIQQRHQQPKGILVPRFSDRQIALQLCNSPLARLMNQLRSHR